VTDRIAVIAIVGPTGVGKTAAAIGLARRLPLEVVSVDSRQVYRQLDIGTGKPTTAERAAVRHHLVDIIEPDDRYDAARFCRDAEAAIRDIDTRGRVPVLVGGTGLYYRALVRGLGPRPPADPALRRELAGEAARAGDGALHARLACLDPGRAARLHPRDRVRVVRALEVAIISGRPDPSPAPGAWAGRAGPYAVRAIGLTAGRPWLYRRLDARVNAMLAGGLLAEVEALLGAGFGPELPAMQGIGYRHLVPVLTGSCSLDDAVRAIKQDTRRYAKRQWTWFAREGGLHWIAVDEESEAGVVAAIERFLETTQPFDYPDRTWRV
jgi:tRNA dimethylallyltransferase